MAVIALAEVSLQAGGNLSNTLKRTARDAVKDFQAEFATGMLTAFAVASVAGIRFAADFERSMNQIKTTTDTTVGQVKELSEAVKNIAADKGVGVNALAEGLYFVRSAGLATNDTLKDTAQTIEILKQGAALTAIGFGDVSDSLKNITSLMIAYKDVNLSAADASGLLLGAVKAGKAEADEFAKTIGDFIPIAAGFGVAAQDALALEAALTRSGQSASESATQVRALITSLVELQTTTDSQKINILQKYNIDAKQVAESIKGEGGLTNTIAQLKDILKGNTADLNILFDNVRASRGLIGAFQNDFEGAYASVARNNIGQLLAEQLKVKDSPVRTFEQLKASVQGFLTTIGQELLPVLANLGESLRPVGAIFGSLLKTFADLVGFVAPLTNLVVPIVLLVKTFNVLKGAVQATEVATKLLQIPIKALAATQTVLQATTGGVSQRLLGMQGAMIATGIASTAAQVALAGIGAVLVGGLLLWQNYKQKQEETKEAVKQVTIALLEGKSAVEAYDLGVKKLFESDKNRDLLLSLGISQNSFKDLATVNESIDKLNQRKKELITERNITVAGIDKNNIIKEIEKIDKALELADKTVEEFKKGFENAFKELVSSGNLQGLGLSFDTVKQALDGTSNTLVTKYTPALNASIIKIGQVKDETLRYELAGRLLEAANKDNYNNITDLNAAFVANVAATQGAESAAAKMASQLTGLSVEAAKARTSITGLTQITFDEFLKSDQFSDIKKLGDAAADLDTAKAASATASDRLKEAEIELSNAKKAQVADIAAQEKAERDRQRALRDARQGVVAAKEKVTKAEQAVDDAREAARQAHYDAEVKGVKKVQEARDAVVDAKNKQDQKETDAIEAFAKIAVKQNDVEKLRTKQKYELSIAERDYADNVKKANQTVVDSQDELAKKLRDFPGVERDVEVAQRAVRDATFAVEGALIAQAKAADDVQNVMLDQKKADTDFAEAQLNVKKSLLGVAQAQLDVNKASNKVAEAQAKVLSAQQDYVNVQNEQVKAYQNVADKSDDLTSAQDKLNKVIRDTSSDSKEAVSALKALRDAQVDIRSTVLDVADAQDKLNKARKAVATGVDGKTGDELRREVTRAEIELQKARNSVIDANDKNRLARSDLGNLSFDQNAKRAAALKDVTKAQRDLTEAQTATTVFAGKYAEVNAKIVAAILDVKQAELDRKKTVLDVQSANLDVIKSANEVLAKDLARKEIITKLTEALYKQREAELAVTKSREAISDAEFGVSEASNKVLDARKEIDKQRIKIEEDLYNAEKIRADGLHDLEQRQIDDAAAIVAAQAEVTQAQKDFRQALKEVEDAKKDVKTATDNVGVAEEELRQKRIAAQKADDLVLERIKDVRDAKQEVIDKTQDLKDLEADQALQRSTEGVAAAEKIREAEKQVAKARQGVADAQSNVNDALGKYDLAKAIASNTEEAKSLKNIQEMVEVIKAIKDPDLQKQVGQTLYNAMVSKINDPAEVQKAMDLWAKYAQDSDIKILMGSIVDSDGNFRLTTDLSKIKISQNPNGETSKRLTAADLPKKEFGGPVLGGIPYLVNERRTEFFENQNGIFQIPGGQHARIFPSDGTVIPSDKALAQRLGGTITDNSTHNYNFTSGATDPELAARRFYEMNRRESLRNRGR